MQQYYNKISEQKRIAFVDNLTDEQALEISENYPFAVCFANADIDPENGKFPVIWLNGQRYGFSSINQNTTKINDVNLSLYIDENGILGLTAENNDFNITPNTSQTITESYLDVKAIIPNHDYSKLTWTLLNDSNTSGKTFKFNNSNENTISEVQSVRVIPNNTSKPEANKGSINLVINNETQSTINGKITLESTFTQDESINENTYSADLKATYESLTPKQIRITYKNSTPGLTVGNWSWNIPTLPEGITTNINNTGNKSTITFTNNTTSDYTINSGIIKVSNTNASPNEISVDEFTIPGKLINSVDISWNGADLGTINGIELGTINTTNDLLNVIKVLAQAINTTPEPVEKQNPVVTAPTAKSGLTYSGSAQQLVNAGSTTGGTLKYSIGTSSAAGTSWSTSIPTGTNANTYYVWYKVDGNDNYNSVDAAGPITVTISKANPNVTAPTAKSGLTYSGSVQQLVNTGSTTGGTLKYSIGTSSAAGTSWGTSIPTGTNANTYYVWYKVDGNDNYNSVDAAGSITVTISKANPNVTAPIAKSGLTYSGSAQQLVNAGSTTGGTLKYSIGTSSAAGTSWSTSIPTGTNANTYYVWYKVDGNDNYNSVNAAGPITVTISAAQPQTTYYWYVGQTDPSTMTSISGTADYNNGGGWTSTGNSVPETINQLVKGFDNTKEIFVAVPITSGTTLKPVASDMTTIDTSVQTVSIKTLNDVNYQIYTYGTGSARKTIIFAKK